MGQLPIVIVQPLEFVALLLWLWLGMKIFAGNAMVSGSEAFPYRLEARVRTITQYVVHTMVIKGYELLLIIMAYLLKHREIYEDDFRLYFD